MKKIERQAIKMMKYLKISEHVIENFKNGMLMVSERQNKEFPAVLYDIKNYTNERVKNAVKEFQSNHPDYVIYHVIYCNTNFGEMANILFVSPYEEDWKYETEGTKDGIAYAYAYNMTDTMLSDMGSIGVRPVMGGLERIW